MNGDGNLCVVLDMQFPMTHIKLLTAKCRRGLHFMQCLQSLIRRKIELSLRIYQLMFSTFEISHT